MQGTKWSQNLVPFHICLPNTLKLSDKGTFNPKDPWLSVWLRPGYKNVALDTVAKATLDGYSALQNTKPRSSRFMDWMVQTNNTQGAHGETGEATVFSDCWSFQRVHPLWLQGWGDIKNGKKKAQLDFLPKTHNDSSGSPEPFSDCFSDISHPSHVSLSSSGPVGWGLLGGDGQCHLCLHRVFMDQAENHAIHLLSFLLPPSSGFSTLVLEQAPEPSPFALCLHLTIWRPFCSHHQVLALPCWVLQAAFQLFQLMQEHFNLCKTLRQSTALESTSLPSCW